MYVTDAFPDCFQYEMIYKLNYRRFSDFVCDVFRFIVFLFREYLKIFILNIIQDCTDFLL